MSQILSQDEVDALLSGISKGGVPTGKDDSRIPREVVAYDLTSQDRVIRGRMPALEIINERFARTFRTTLSTQLRKVVDIGSPSITIAKFGEFMKTMYVPTSLHVFRMDPIRGHALLVLETNLVFSLIEAFFGGKGTKGIKIEGREFTNIENRMIRKVADAALVDYEKAWNPVYPLSIHFVRSEVNPQFVGIVPTSDLVVVASFELEMANSVGKLIFCIPYSCLEPIRSLLEVGFQSGHLEVDRVWVDRFKDQLVQATVRISAELGRTKIKGKDLLNLEVGDVVLLDRSSSEKIDVRVEGVLKFKGYPGLFRGNRAIRIS